MATDAEETIAFLEQRRRAYQLTFSSPAGKEVLKDLAKFCRANWTCFEIDARMHALFEGRREVWLRLTEHFELDIEDLARRYAPTMTLQPAKEPEDV